MGQVYKGAGDRVTKIDGCIKSLAMAKMEKNFVAVNDKGYTRQPYDEYPVYGLRLMKDGVPTPSHESLMGFVMREVEELDYACYWAFAVDRDVTPDDVLAVLHEIADVSNTLDFLYEAVLRELIRAEREDKESAA